MQKTANLIQAPVLQLAFRARMLRGLSSTLILLVLLGASPFVRSSCPKQSNVKKVTFSNAGTKLSGSKLQNPERGFYYPTETNSSSLSPLNLRDLQDQKLKTGVTLIFRNYVLNSFVSSDISSSFLSLIGKDFDIVRQAGMKAVVRFCYSVTEGDDRDAVPNQLMSHINQLKSVLQKNADVILVLQAGFIGTWGEWAFSKNYAVKKGKEDYDPFVAPHWSNRMKIISALLSAVPSSRMVQLRTPTFWQKYCNTTSALPASSAFSGAGCSRLGIHNDCFLAPGQDMGTFDSNAQRKWLTEQAKYVMTGGETCAANGATTECSGAKKEIQAQRFTYLNNGYKESVIKGWKNGGCFDDIEGMLGYRYQLIDGTFPSSVKRGDVYCATVNVANTGVAPIYNERKVEVVFRHQTTKQTTSLSVKGVDPRRWAPDTVTPVDLSVTIPSNLAAGTYDVLLSLADAASSLNTAAYRILVTNPTAQDKSTRYNVLAPVTVA